MFLHSTVCSVTSPIPKDGDPWCQSISESNILNVQAAAKDHEAQFWAQYAVLPKYGVSASEVPSPSSFLLSQKRDNLQHPQPPAQRNLGRKTQWRSKGAQKHFLKQLPAHNAPAHSTAQQYSTFHLHQAGDPDT